MQKTLGFAILTAVLVIIFLMQPITQVTIVKANFYPFGVPIIQVHSPNTNPYISMKPTVNVSFDYQVAEDLTQVNYFSYNLDEKGSSMLTTSMSEFSYNTIKYIKYSVSTTLENLPNGNHTISVHTNFLNGTISQILHLLIIVDTAYITPVPFMISPFNQTTYNTQQVPLIYTINANVLYSHYSLDAPDDLPINHWTG
jgi:hypothetical protein